MKIIKISLDCLPQAKKRHRSRRLNGRVIQYDPQTADKLKFKRILSTTIRAQGLLKPLESAVSMSVASFYEFPKSWSKKRIKRVKEEGAWKTSKPDADNEGKFWCDVLNGIAYNDDAQVVQLLCEKRYSDKASVEIIIKPKEVFMIDEHATTIKNSCSIEDISFLVKKANRLGKSNREITHVYVKDDDEGSHIFFEVDEMRPKRQ